jgi:hypothetical protein
MAGSVGYDLVRWGKVRLGMAGRVRFGREW